MQHRPWFALSTAALLALALACCCHGRWDAPEILTVSPAPDAVDVSTDVEIRVEFDRRIRASSLNGGNFYLWDVDAAVEVDGQRSYEVENRTAVLRPSNPLQPGRRYRAVVDDDVRSERYGIRLRHARIWEFTTAAAMPVVLDVVAARWQLQLLAQLLAERAAIELPGAGHDACFALALDVSRAFVLELTSGASEHLARAIACVLLGDEPGIESIHWQCIDCSGLSPGWAVLLCEHSGEFDGCTPAWCRH